MPYEIPDIPAWWDKKRHATAYARLGWYLVPVRRGEKHPGSLLGKNWQDQSSNSIAQVRSWWSQWPDAEIALHCGRSGLLVVDVDHPEAVPPVLAEALTGAPFARTRKDSASDGERGHYFFRQPAGRMLGNSPGSLGRGWGEIRGDNGVVILAGSEHYHEVFPEKAAKEKAAGEPAGHYAWERVGAIPMLPQVVAAVLGDAVDHAPAAESVVVNGWLEAHSDPDGQYWCEKASGGPIRWFRRRVESEAGLSRHDLGRDAVCMTLREGAVGAYPVAPVLVELRAVWEDSLKGGPRGGRSPGVGEWDSFLLWSVAQMSAFEASTAAQTDVRSRITGAHGVSAQHALGISEVEFHALWESGWAGPAARQARWDRRRELRKQTAATVAGEASGSASGSASVGSVLAGSAAVGPDPALGSAGAAGGEEPEEEPEEEYEPRRQRTLRDASEDTRWLLAEMGRNGLAGLFRRGPHVVYTPHIDEQGYLPPDEEMVSVSGPFQVQKMTGSILRSRVSVIYDVVRYKPSGSGRNSGIKATFPLFPLDCAIAALDAQEGEAANLRELKGTTHTPMVRADGTLFDEPGYDASTGYLYLPTEGMEQVSVAEAPTRRAVLHSTRLLRGMVAQFPFVTEHDEANYLGLLLTPLLRLLAPPPYKLGVFNATNPGTGKSLLVEVMGQIHGLEKYNEMPGSAEELEKVLAGVLSTTTNPVVCFDNVVGVLRSSKLAALLTSSSYSARVLGTTNSTGLVNDRIWTVTGNSVALGGDMPRRALWISLDTGAPNPEARGGFDLNLIGGWATAHRVELFTALLTWVRAWSAAGMPREMLPEDSYGRWISVVRGILSTAGVPGVFAHSDSSKVTVGEDDSDWAEFLHAVHQRFGTREWMVAELFGHVEGTDVGPEEIVGALPNILHEKYLRAGAAGAQVVARSLGRWLMNRAGRWVDGLAVKDCGMSRMQRKKWQIVER